LSALTCQSLHQRLTALNDPTCPADLVLTAIAHIYSN